MKAVLRRIPCVPPYELKVELETRLTNNVDGQTREILRDMVRELDRANTMFTQLYKFACAVKWHITEMAKQTLVISPGELSTTFGTDDTCQFTSETDLEFDFQDGGRITVIQLGDDPPMLLSMVEETGTTGEWARKWDGAAYFWEPKTWSVLPHDIEPRKLFARGWDEITKTMVPHQWIVGWTVKLWQIRPPGGL